MISDAGKWALRDGDASVLVHVESVQPLRRSETNVIAKTHSGARIYMYAQEKKEEKRDET